MSVIQNAIGMNHKKILTYAFERHTLGSEKKYNR